MLPWWATLGGVLLGYLFGALAMLYPDPDKEGDQYDDDAY